MNWDDIRYFLSVCREGTVTGAGRVLEVNHSTVARRIAAFEQALGARLFDRTRDGYVMTQAAEDMYAQAELVEENVRAIDRNMYGRDSALKGSLKLTAHEQFAEVILAPELVRFHRVYPGVELALLTTTAVLDLAARAADLAIRFTRQPADDLIGRRLMSLGLGLYCSAGYLDENPSRARVLVNRVYKEQPWVREHFPDAELVLRADSLGTLAAAIRHGVGIGVLPCFVADVDPSLRRLDLTLPPPEAGIWIVSHVDMRTTARVRATRDFVAAVVEKRSALIMGQHSRYTKQA